MGDKEDFIPIICTINHLFPFFQPYKTVGIGVRANFSIAALPEVRQYFSSGLTKNIFDSRRISTAATDIHANYPIHIQRYG